MGSEDGELRPGQTQLGHFVRLDPRSGGAPVLSSRCLNPPCSGAGRSLQPGTLTHNFVPQPSGCASGFRRKCSSRKSAILTTIAQGSFSAPDWLGLARA